MILRGTAISFVTKEKYLILSRVVFSSLFVVGINLLALRSSLFIVCVRLWVCCRGGQMVAAWLGRHFENTGSGLGVACVFEELYECLCLNSSLGSNSTLSSSSHTHLLPM